MKDQIKNYFSRHTYMKNKIQGDQNQNLLIQTVITFWAHVGKARMCLVGLSLFWKLYKNKWNCKQYQASLTQFGFTNCTRKAKAASGLFLEWGYNQRCQWYQNLDALYRTSEFSTRLRLFRNRIPPEQFWFITNETATCCVQKCNFFRESCIEVKPSLSKSLTLPNISTQECLFRKQNSDFYNGGKLLWRRNLFLPVGPGPWSVNEFVLGGSEWHRE